MKSAKLGKGSSEKEVICKGNSPYSFYVYQWWLGVGLYK